MKEENNNKNIESQTTETVSIDEKEYLGKTNYINDDATRLAFEQIKYISNELEKNTKTYTQELQKNVKTITDISKQLSDSGFLLFKLPDQINESMSKHVKDSAPEVAKRIIDATLDGFNQKVDDSMIKAHKLLDTIATYEKMKFKSVVMKMIGTIILTTSVAAATSTLILRGYPNKIVIDAGDSPVKIDNSYVDVMGVSALTEANALFKETTRELKAKKDKQMIENYKARQKKLEKEEQNKD